MYVVKKLQSTDGVGGNYNLTYAYQGGHRDVQGRGFLGFAHRNITDSRTGFVTQETYNNTVGNDGTSWEFAGTLAESKVLQSAGGAVLQDTSNKWASFAPGSAANRRFPYIKTKTVTSYELGNSGTSVSTVVATTMMDNYGTPYDVVTTTTENSTGLNSGSVLTAHRSYPQANILNDTTDWCLIK